MDKLCDLLKENVLQRMDFSKEATEEEVRSLIAEEIDRSVTKENLSIKQRVYLEKRVFYALRGLDVLQELLEDEEVTEIMVNGPKRIFFEKGGRITQYPYSFSSEERLQDVIQQIAPMDIRHQCIQIDTEQRSGSIFSDNGRNQRPAIILHNPSGLGKIGHIPVQCPDHRRIHLTEYRKHFVSYSVTLIV